MLITILKILDFNKTSMNREITLRPIKTYRNDRKLIL